MDRVKQDQEVSIVEASVEVFAAISLGHAMKATYEDLLAGLRQYGLEPIQGTARVVSGQDGKIMIKWKVQAIQ